MNEQFSMIYTLLFLSAIIGSFIALKTSIEYWANYEIFLIDSNEMINSIMLSKYFDSYSANLNFSNNLNININSSIIFLSRDNYFKQFDNLMSLKDANLDSKDFIIIKNIEGVSLI